MQHKKTRGGRRMSKKISKECFTVEQLMESYSSQELKKILRFCLVNDIQVLSERDIALAVSLAEDDNLLDYFYHFPKGVKAPLNKFFWTTDFDCKCEGKCNITDLSKTLIKALYKIRLSYRSRINIVRGYECTPRGDDDQSRQHSKGCALCMQVGDLDRLYKIIDEGEYSHYTLGRDDNFIYLNLNTNRDNNNNIDPVGPRWDHRSITNE